MIPQGTATKVAKIVAEVGGISRDALASLLQWEGISPEDTAFVVRVLKRYRVLEESDGLIRPIGESIHSNL